MNEDKVGFYSLESTSDATGYIGALLITDELGKPEEFRVTYPVKPTLLQRQLYGESLFPHIGVELCGRPLYQALQNKPVILIAADNRFLSLAESISCHVAYINRLGDMMKVVQEDDELHSVHSPSGRFEPVAVDYPQHYSGKEQQETAALLKRFFAGIDLVEPFERIRVALKALAKQDEKFR